MTFPPSPWHVSLHVGGFIAWHGCWLAVVGWLLQPSWWATGLQALMLVGAVYFFPGGLLRQRFVVTPEALIYREGGRDPRRIPWARVTAYRFRWLDRFVVLLDERDGVGFLLGKPVVTKHRARLRRTIVERCPGARSLSRVEYWKVVLRPARGEMREGAP